MRVLIVHDYGTLHGGAEHMSVALRDGLRLRGHDARFFSSTARPLPLEIVADYTCFGTMSGARRLLQVANPWAARGLRDVLRKFEPDVVHVRMFLTQLSPLILRPLAGYRSLLHVVNYDLICPLNTKTLPDGLPCHHRAGVACYRAGCVPPLGAARALAQAGLWRRWQGVFGLIVANSEWTKRRLLADGIGVAEAIPNGVPVRPARPPLGEPPTVAFAGRLWPKKGVDVLLRAMARVVAEIPQARLILAGDGPERPALEGAIAELGLSPAVAVLGHRPREELEQLLAGAWVQAVPSRWEEPFGLVAAEAMMRGTAVVASNSGGVSELVSEGRTGFRVPAGEPEALAQALVRILRDRELAERMGAEARAVALAELSEDRTVERFLDVYDRLRPVSARSAAALVPAVHR
jgi:glycosyltransferase involved in cell wall biosynthesis